jgi:hypothetical protein
LLIVCLIYAAEEQFSAQVETLQGEHEHENDGSRSPVLAHRM